MGLSISERMNQEPVSDGEAIGQTDAACNRQRWASMGVNASRYIEDAAARENYLLNELERLREERGALANDPVGAAAMNAPVGPPMTEEKRAGVEEAIADKRLGVPHADVMAMVDRAANAMKRFGVAGERAAITLGEVLHWLDSGETCAAIAALIAAEKTIATDAEVAEALRLSALLVARQEAIAAWQAAARQRGYYDTSDAAVVLMEARSKTDAAAREAMAKIGDLVPKVVARLMVAERKQ